MQQICSPCVRKQIETLDIFFQVGGLVSLFMGFSLVSVFELVYWFTYRLGKNLLQGRDVEKPQ